MMIEIKEGPELDIAVAEAIGFLRVDTTYGVRWIDPVKLDPTKDRGVIPAPCDCEFGDGFSSCEHWSPSTDLNATFTAAGRISRAFSLYSAVEVGIWECWLVDPDRSEYRADAATPILAICAAILKLKGSDDEN